MQKQDKALPYPTYDAYKDSGVEWLGEIPEGWKILSNRYIFKLKKNLVGKHSNKYELLSLTLKGIIKRDMENPEGKFPAEFDTYQEVKKEDFVFCLFDVEETPRTVGLSPYHGMITGAYTVLEVNKCFDRQFLYYFYLNLDDGKKLKTLYRGLRNTIPKEKFFSFKTLLPKLEEQTAIANFLDEKCTKIKQAIAQKERLINLLQERKQIVIQTAVTKGLDSDVPMKDSGVDWIGEIPKHWKVKKLNYVAKIDSGATPDRSRANYWNGSIPWVKTGEVKYNIITNTEEYITKAGLNNAAVKIAPIGTILMAMYGQGVTRGRVSILDIPATYNQACCAMNFDKTVLTRYAYYFFVFSYSYIRDSGNETSQMNISTGYISSLKIIIPSLKEQKKIVKHIETQTTKIDTAIHLQRAQIEQLQAYQRSLIDSAVRGRIKVV